MEMIDKMKELLKREYGINNEAELLEAMESQDQLNIGIFVSPCGMEGLHEKAVS